MVKQKHIATLFATIAYAASRDRRAWTTRSESHAGHSDLSGNERQEIAEQIRAIATRAAQQYRDRHEPVPPYVLSAMECGLKTDRRAPAYTFKPALQQGLEMLRGAFADFVLPIGQMLRHAFAKPVLPIILLAVITLGAFGLVWQARQAEFRQLEKQLATLRQQNSDLLSQIKKLNDSAAEMIWHFHTEESQYRNLKKELKKEHARATTAIKALRDAVLAANRQPHASQHYSVALDDLPPAHSLPGYNRGGASPLIHPVAQQQISAPEQLEDPIARAIMRRAERSQRKVIKSRVPATVVSPPVKGPQGTSPE